MNGWLAIAIGAPAVLFWIRIRFAVIHIPIALLIGWAIITVQWTPVTADAIDALWKTALCLMLFCIGFETESIDRFYVAAGMVLIPSGIVAAWQAWSGDPITGLFGNPNLMGEAAALVIVGLVCGDKRHHAFELAVLPVLLLSQARGAILAALAILAGHRSLVVLILVCMVAVFLLPFHRGDFLAANSLIERATIWSDTASQLTFFGHGIGGYAESLHSTLSSRVVEHAHNDFLEIAFELGAPGSILAALIIGAVFLSGCNRERLVLLALGMEALFGFPLHSPATAALGAVVAGHAARAWDDIRWGLIFGRPVFLDGNAVDRLRG